jgi:hypothetical protein
MNLLDIAKGLSTRPRTHAVLVYGAAKTGKTRFVGTAAKMASIKRIFWFDGENGAETLLSMGLTNEELAKVTLIQIPDTKEIPRFGDTLLKAFSLKNGAKVSICERHGAVACAFCTSKNFPSVEFSLPTLTKEDLIVIDSGSQLGDSFMSKAVLGRDIDFKPTWDEYSLQGMWLSAVLSTVQAAEFTNFVMITHSITVEVDEHGIKKDVTYPLVGTKAFSTKVGKYFGHVVYLEIKQGKHVGGSSTTYKDNYMTGSRRNIAVESTKGGISIEQLLTDAGMVFTQDIAK